MARSKSKHRRKQMKIKQHWKARANRKKAAVKAAPATKKRASSASAAAS